MALITATLAEGGLVWFEQFFDEKHRGQGRKTEKNNNDKCIYQCNYGLVVMIRPISLQPSWS